MIINSFCELENCFSPFSRFEQSNFRAPQKKHFRAHLIFARHSARKLSIFAPYIDRAAALREN